jgi:DNA-binding NtrC family response regulator
MIMPGMGGGEVFERIKEMNPDVKVLLASGYSVTSQITDILDSGCGGFMQKPFNMSRLSKKIRDVLDEK